MGGKILLIENDIFLGEKIVQTLTNNLYEVVWSKDGTQGFQKISEIKPDLILLDVGMPNMTGYEILTAKTKDAALKDIPVVIISDSGDSVEISRVLALGVRDDLVKVQLTPEEGLAKVKNQLGEKVLDISTGAVPSGASLNGKKILWIEDDEFLSSIITQRLAKEKGIVMSGTKGGDVVGLAEHEMPDIIMLDILLPGMDGMEILKQLKSNGKTKHIPVIVFSNFDDKTKIEQSKDLGAAGFFVKASINLDEIVNEMRKAIAAHPA